MAATKNGNGLNGFGKPANLDDAWLEAHGEHILIWCKHTVFTGMDGTEYSECRCYSCRQIARKTLREVATTPEKKPPKEVRKMRKNNFGDAESLESGKPLKIYDGGKGVIW